MSNVAVETQQFTLLEEARRVLLAEAAAIQDMADHLGENFNHALALMHSAKGRVIVTGMGKSGHVARKIAATLASTGTPSFFVHPAEAAHGDLGMITHDDVVLALSNSGETAELIGIIHYTRRNQIPLIAMTSKTESFLSKTAEVSLLLPKVSEACPIGLAPTTSTTMMMALGDALAVALLKERGFSQEDFNHFHPGGALGKKLLTVKDIMHTGDKLPLVEQMTKMDLALLQMTAKGFGVLGVVDASENLVGIVTDGDLRRHMGNDLFEKTAQKVMTPNPKSIVPTDLVAKATAVLNEHKITCLFVCDPGSKKPKGLVHIHDCLREEQ
jgi:arabinose-5-phosphate isomerase